MNEKGFTLIEMIAVLFVLGILAAIAVHKIVKVDERANQVALNSTITEMNSLELSIWAQKKFEGQTDDSSIFTEVINVKTKACNFETVSEMGGILECNGIKVKTKRTPSTSKKPATWSIE